MSTSSSRFRILLSRFGTLLEALFIFILLLSGISIVFIVKITGLLEVGMVLLSFGLAVQIVAFVILGVYTYIRFLRSGIATE